MEQLVNHILYALLIAISTATVRNIALYQNILKVIGLWRKPFSCALCLGFWSGLSFFIFNDVNLGLALLLAFLTAYTSEEVDKTQNKLF